MSSITIKPGALCNRQVLFHIDMACQMNELFLGMI